MRRNRNIIGKSLATDKEIRNSAVCCWLSIILFGLWATAELVALFIEFEVIYLLRCLLLWLIVGQAILQLRRLSIFKRNFLSDPQKYSSRYVPKPIMYRAVFWMVK